MVVFSRAIPLSVLSIALYTFSTIALGGSPPYRSDGVVAEPKAVHKDQQQDAVVSNVTNSDALKKQWAWEGSLVGDTLPKDMEKDEFVTLLKQRFYGSFVLYNRLQTTDQESIYTSYKALSEPNINDIRKAILKYKT